MAANDKYLIELTYDDLLVAEAENLFEKNAIIDVTTPEKNLFLFVIHDGEDLETEIFKPFTKVQKSTCPCAFHQKNKICKHVIAGLFYIREQAKKRKYKKEAGHERKIKTLNTRTLLQFADREELIQFVQQYAKSDAKFALQLKVHFARKVDLPDNREKYKILLDSIIRPYTGKSKPGAADLRAFLQISEELTGQAHDCIALENFEEALHIIEAGLLKFCYVRHYYGMESSVFTRQHQSWHVLTESFLQHKIPFTIKKAMLNFLTELAGMSFYRYTDVHANVVKIAAKFMNKPEKKQFYTQLLEKVHPVHEDEKAVFTALICWLTGSVMAPVRAMIQKPGFRMITFYHHLLNLEMKEVVREELLVNIQKSAFDKEMFAMLSRLYIEEKDWNKAIAPAVIYFKHCGDLSLFQEIKKTAGEEVWLRELYPDLLNSLQRETALKPIFLGQFLQSEKEWDHLLHLLYTKNDIHLLHAFCQVLYYNRPEETEILYTEHVKNYLENHLGDISHEYLHQVFDNLDRLKLFQIKQSIRRMIKTSFSDRQGLKPFIHS